MESGGGSMAGIDNYSPISILPTLSKILERMMHKKIMKHLEFNLSEDQFGFRPNRSTELAVIFFTDEKKRTGVKLQEQSSLTCLKRLTPSAILFC